MSDTAIGARATERRRSLRLPRRPGAVIAGSLLALIVLAVIAAPLLTSYGPNAIDPANAFQPPSSTHWMGTDEIGRDIFSRMLYGGRITLGAALGATTLSMVLGIAWGYAAALGVPLVDEVLMRTADVAMAIPQILFGLVFIAAFGTSLLNLIVIVGILLSPTSGRLIRSVVLAEREADYVRAAVAFGATRWSIAAKEIFPNTTSHLGVLVADQHGERTPARGELQLRRAGRAAAEGVLGNDPPAGLPLHLRRLLLRRVPGARNRARHAPAQHHLSIVAVVAGSAGVM